MRENIQDLGLGKEFIDLSTKIIVEEKKYINWTLLKLKAFAL